MATTPMVVRGPGKDKGNPDVMQSNPVKRKRCRFIDDQACEEDENGYDVDGQKNDEDDDDIPNEEDLAFINDEVDDLHGSDDDKVRISRKEKELTEEDLELIQTNAGIIAQRVEPTKKRRFKRLERARSSRVYKDSDEDDVHASDDGFIESDSDGSDDRVSSRDSSPVCPPREHVLRAIPIVPAPPVVSNETASASNLLDTDKFWREDEEPQESDLDEIQLLPPIPVKPPATVHFASIFQKGFKSSVLAPARSQKPGSKKAPVKRPVVKRPEWDADQPGYVYNRSTGELMYRDATGELRRATGVDPF